MVSRCRVPGHRRMTIHEDGRALTVRALFGPGTSQLVCFLIYHTLVLSISPPPVRHITQ